MTEFCVMIHKICASRPVSGAGVARLLLGRSVGADEVFWMILSLIAAGLAVGGQARLHGEWFRRPVTTSSPAPSSIP